MERTPAAGRFEGWPERAAEVTVMDPCCGSGHFLVTAFELLRRMRMEEEGLSETDAADAVLRDNLYGLEIDPRCTQIAAFALAFAAWKAGGYRPLPALHIACSGIPVQGQFDEWRRLASGDTTLVMTLQRLHDLFRNAPDLGSLINPAAVTHDLFWFTATPARVEPLLTAALAREKAGDDPAAAVFGESAAGVARAAALLARQYTLVATNVPYLARGKQGETLRAYIAAAHPNAKADLATAFVERCRAFAAPGGTYALVTPQNWLFLRSYKKLREALLREQTWEHVSRLGPGAFETISGEVVNVALPILTNRPPAAGHTMTGIDASVPRSPREKATLLRTVPLHEVEQAAQLRNPDAKIVLDAYRGQTLLESYAESLQGVSPADFARFGRMFWETSSGSEWRSWINTVEFTTLYGGRERVLWWNHALLKAFEDGTAYLRGQRGWGKRGVVVSQMRGLPCTLYLGELGNNNGSVILPHDEKLLPAIWSYCSSPDYERDVRRIDQKLWVTNSTLVKVPFDLDHWQRVAAEKYPNGLPEPHSDDPTQWLFKGHPRGSTAPLQVAVARLLGYRWPAEHDAEKVGVHYTEEERLRTLLAAAYGSEWSTVRLEVLLAEVGYGGRGLEEWLRDGFFVQHCRLFHNRPFIWHIWDGRRDGFAALVNYHRLDHAALGKLIYTYLGDWIARRRADREANVPGADGRLEAALALQAKLIAIREGEPPYDIYVRWKPRHEQPIGWNPDLNDGVRVNIRPFILPFEQARVPGPLRAKFTINWHKDRGKNPDGSERLNDLHFSNEEKRKARAAAGAPVAGDG